MHIRSWQLPQFCEARQLALMSCGIVTVRSFGYSPASELLRLDLHQTVVQCSSHECEWMSKHEAFGRGEQGNTAVGGNYLTVNRTTVTVDVSGIGE
jgi:hypothetical protein